MAQSRRANPPLMNAHFGGNNGHDADETRCLLMTQSGHSDLSTFNKNT